MSVQPGEIWPMDRYGRAKNAAGRAQLRPVVRRAAGAVAQSYYEHLGEDLHSVYLTGPAARGRPGPLAAFGVMRLPAPAPETAWLAGVSGAVAARWPRAGAPELTIEPWTSVFPADDRFSLVRFRLGVNALCIFGRDLSHGVAPQRPSVAAANAWIAAAGANLTEISDAVSLTAAEDDLRRLAQRLGRLLLETGFALVMTHEGVYTEDLDLQRDLFALNYPSRAEDAAFAHEFAANPPASAPAILELLDGFGRWLTAEADMWLDEHNPARMSALHI